MKPIPSTYIDKIPLIYILLIAPLLYPTDAFLPGITAHFIFLFLLSVGYIFLSREKTFVWGKLDLLFLLFLTYYTFRVLGNETGVEAWNICLAIGSLLLYLYTRHSSLKSEVFYMLLIAGIVQATWFWLQYFQILPSYNNNFKGTGAFFNPAILAITLTLSCLSGIYTTIRIKHKTARLFLYLTCTILIFTLTFLHSRAAWVALASGLLWLIFSDNKLYRFRKTLLYIILFLAPVSLYLLYLLSPLSVQGRFLIWQVSGKLFLTNPLFGSGQFASSYMPAQGEWLTTHPTSSFILLADDTLYPFNEFIRIACETGIIGLLLFLGLLVTTFYIASRGNQLSRHAGGILFALMTFGMFSYPLSIPWLVAIMIIMIAIILQENQKQIYIIRQDKSFTFIRQIAICVLLLSFSVQYYHCKQADNLLKQAQTSISTANGSQLASCYKHFSNNPDFVLCYAKILYNNQQYLQAIPVLQQAYKIKPLYSIARDLGICYQELHSWTKAEEQFLLASQLIPGRISPRASLLQLYQQTQQYQKAQDMANIILNHPVKRVSSSVLRARSEAKKVLNETSSTRSTTD